MQTQENKFILECHPTNTNTAILKMQIKFDVN